MTVVRLSPLPPTHCTCDNNAYVNPGWTTSFCSIHFIEKECRCLVTQCTTFWQQLRRHTGAPLLAFWIDEIEMQPISVSHSAQRLSATTWGIKAATTTHTGVISLITQHCHSTSIHMAVFYRHELLLLLYISWENCFSLRYLCKQGSLSYSLLTF